MLDALPSPCILLTKAFGFHSHSVISIAFKELIFLRPHKRKSFAPVAADVVSKSLVRGELDLAQYVVRKQECRFRCSLKVSM